MVGAHAPVLQSASILQYAVQINLVLLCVAPLFKCYSDRFC